MGSGRGGGLKEALENAECLGAKGRAAGLGGRRVCGGGGEEGALPVTSLKSSSGQRWPTLGQPGPPTAGSP